MDTIEDRDEEHVRHALDRMESSGTGSPGSDSESDDTLRTMREVRAAMLRKSAFRPNVDDEWLKVSTRLGFESQVNKGVRVKPRRALWMASGISIGVAASILVFLLLRGSSPVKPADDSVVVYSALGDRQGVEMSVLDHAGETESGQETSGNPEVIFKAPAASEKGVLDEGMEVIDMRGVKTSGDMEERIIRTPVGKEIRVILADNTEVLLNGESSLRFPVRFNGDIRRVWLEGEAYFDVAEDPARPFDVVSQNYITTALGTEFDVKAYTRADVKISLIEGSVRVEDTSNNSTVVLAPGQDVKCVGGKLVVSDIDTKAFRYWKDGYFYFADEPLVDMLVELGRWYNINIELSKRSLMGCRMHFVAKRDENMSDIVERLNMIGNFTAVFDGETLTIDEKH